MGSGLGSPVVLEVGPATVRRLDAGTDPPVEMVTAALDGIDDPLVLLDERPVRVDDLLRSLIAQALGGRCADVVVVHPSGWPDPRVARVVRAVAASADRVVPVTRAEFARRQPPTVSRRIRLRRSHVTVTALAALAVAGVVAMRLHGRPPTSSALPAVITSTVVEGRIAVVIPDGWAVERLTRGPGSRRVRVSSPVDPDQALHITQSYAPGTTLADAGAVLGRAVATQPPGVFVDFRPDAVVAGRPAVTYREQRTGRAIRWVVLLDGSTRISIGCQSAAGAEIGIGAVCEQAIRSAHELVGTTAGG
ncbi:MAG: type VII secretion-associated protein [Mycobacterium sp.]